jgi:hypothetical protein
VLAEVLVSHAVKRMSDQAPARVRNSKSGEPFTSLAYLISVCLYDVMNFFLRKNLRKSLEPCKMIGQSDPQKGRFRTFYAGIDKGSLCAKRGRTDSDMLSNFPSICRSVTDEVGGTQLGTKTGLETLAASTAQIVHRRTR